ncbi:Endonuclease/Exonuclease/phosphatase family protein [Alkalispirochaeta americana]|uniref:Endonuclease/Exonuclease/phosphatase family protein n=1 Tax=Alkalispirochaeta americana TaxID=159291 RepID=A0A1N6UED0_9SPIO|nr:endonuclease/exonuclease/phosphatase family protein [Alkalispirochaeta americana]SIQ63917.1 Endonuclease/Exonuclease/phosphatase family protein [Alkalispirochaeta americana]
MKVCTRLKHLTGRFRGVSWGCILLGPALATALGCLLILPDDDTITILSWNIENLFDAVDQGSEYHQFTSAGGWTERDYHRRKERIAQALQALRPRPDIFIFLEIENREVLDDLMDRHLVDVHAPYRVFAKGPGAAIGIGVASRYPIRDARTHLARAGEFPPLRPVVETRIDLAGTDLVIFSNHWKSKRGGAPATEPLRRASAQLLAARVEQLYREEPDLSLLVAGDFNERPLEFELSGRSYPTALMPARELLALARELAAGEGNHPSWVTPEWIREGDHLIWDSSAREAILSSSLLDRPVFVNLWEDIDAPGSFYFINRWERIDSMFLSPSLFSQDSALRFSAFSVPCPRDGCDSRGRPLSWEDDPRGVSDHLPLLLTLIRSP